MFLAALITLWPARSTDRVLEQFWRGEFLADWRFPADEWEVFLERECARFGKGRWFPIPAVVAPLRLCSDTLVGR